MEILIVTGMSGAGKSQAASILEDIGYYCVDNMPVPLIPKFAEFCIAAKGRYERVALVTDIRGGQDFEGLFASLEELSCMGCEVKILFLRASVRKIISRYKETRRPHPLYAEGESMEDTIGRESGILAPLSDRADYVLDTSDVTRGQLREKLIEIFGGGAMSKAYMSVDVMSFGFKYGIPIEADLVFDVRFLPNPFYIMELREKTGLDAEVREYLFKWEMTVEFLRRLAPLFDFLLPSYAEEGKSALTVAVGCTGGRHRSVAMAEEICGYILGLGYSASVKHRDIGRAPAESREQDGRRPE